MTGTADTEAYEFQQIYGLEVVVIPTHKPMVRKDNQDVIFLKQKFKFEAVIEDIKDCHSRGQPVLVGTTSIETSELLSDLLKKENVAHEVLNAKQHEREAQIVAQAGRPGAVTIATNMAGRGTDIVLGGSLECGTGRAAGRDQRRRTRADQASSGRSAMTTWSPPAACTSSAPSATSRGASTTSCAAAPGVRAIRGRAASTCRSKIR